jgi:CheY-like chemotaxis protein
VEDEQAVREVTQEALQLGGYHVLAADGPLSATLIAADRGTPIDLLLTDVVMPGMTGPELAQKVRETRPQVATLFMTGYAESEVLRLAKTGVRYNHIQKPFTVSGLLTRVAETLANCWNQQMVL